MIFLDHYLHARYRFSHSAYRIQYTATLVYNAHTIVNHRNNTIAYVQTDLRQLWEMVVRENPLDESELIGITPSQLLASHNRPPTLKPRGLFDGCQQEILNRLQGELNVLKVADLEARNDILTAHNNNITTLNDNLNRRIEELEARNDNLTTSKII
ncbi:hypothetical protein PROFUN_09007 [Planoprotostelium fungivorum]|uniref:Uncharacterized protein n=1 Tax=Planoprotostelium fungivorum TaxID=1890364 RepID=A0A2P6MUX4_9EUKA|nr:hypothetical protein PROFUN_09007 [Planoprotostelium fungivorum]